MKKTLYSDNALALIKTEEAGRTKKEKNEKQNDWNNESPLKQASKWKPWHPSLNPAVEYVKKERQKEGLPKDVKEEMRELEEKTALADVKATPEDLSLDTYLDTHSFSRKIATQAWAEKVAQSLVDWINRPREKDENGVIKDPIKITEFFREKGIFHRDFHLLRRKYEILEHAYQYAQSALGDIRERNMLEGKWNPTVGMFTMGQYDPNWREEQERRESAKLKQAEAAGVNVNALMAEMITPVPQTEEVRVKLEQDKKRVGSGNPNAGDKS